jgi:hypothetical protein
MDCPFCTDFYRALFSIKKSGDNMKIKNKKAEMTTQQIVILIILITSFAVVMFFLARLKFGGTTEEEVCHNSVMVRSAGFPTRQVVPLNCKTKYICISKDGSCENMVGREVIRVNNPTEFYGALAELMADCWWMFGEGRVDYVGNTADYELYCSVCSQVGFDDSIEKIFPKVTLRSEGIAGQSANDSVLYWRAEKSDLYDYLAKENVSGKGITYLEYFLGIRDSSLISGTLEANNKEFGPINLDSRYLVTMGEFSKMGDLYGALKAVYIFLPFLVGKSPIQIIASTIEDPTKNYMVGTIVTGESGHNYLTPALIEASSDEYSKFKCGDITTLA